MRATHKGVTFAASVMFIIVLIMMEPIMLARPPPPAAIPTARIRRHCYFGRQLCAASATSSDVSDALGSNRAR